MVCPFPSPSVHKPGGRDDRFPRRRTPEGSKKTKENRLNIDENRNNSRWKDVEHRSIRLIIFEVGSESSETNVSGNGPIGDWRTRVTTIARRTAVTKPCLRTIPDPILYTNQKYVHKDGLYKNPREASDHTLLLKGSQPNVEGTTDRRRDYDHIENPCKQ